MARRTKDQVTQLLSAVHRRPAASSQSPLYRWMRKHHDRLLAGLEISRPSWTPLADQFGAMGLLDATGKPPTPEGARNTWYRVRRDLANKRAADQTVKSASADMMSGVRLIAADVSQALPARERPAPSNGHSAPPVAGKAQLSPEQVEEAIRMARQSLGGGRTVRMPQQIK